MSSLADFTVRATGDDAQRLEALYRTGSADLIHGTGAETFDAVKMLKSANPQRYQPEHGADYPQSPFGQSLLQIAQLIKSDVGLEIAFADVGGWDTHVNQGGATGQLANRLGDFALAIAAFVADLGDRMDDVVIVTMSEFGRMAKQNGNGGTDHGHAGALFVIGGAVHGHKVHGTWPGLAREQLYEGRDLALTTDFRSGVRGDHAGSSRRRRVLAGYFRDIRRFPSGSCDGVRALTSSGEKGQSRSPKSEVGEQWTVTGASTRHLSPTSDFGLRTASSSLDASSR